ncbi:MAG TPA: hypothetical protein VGT01_00935, partial [Candidatus Dormibacteraeota bacterium]|nr:hypothetical protein [Candidatus Dormibacteraeota bacterium]
FGPFIISAAPVIVLWTQHPFEQVTVNGARPREYVESAVVLNPPIAQFGSGAIAAGIVNGRLVDIDANVTPAGPPGVLTANSGSMTFSFKPTLVTGKRLQSVKLNSSNPYGMKLGAPGTATPAVLHAQVWDWTTSQWVDVNYIDSGTTAVPEDAVNPSTGEVRLKLSSDGQFTTVFLSASGTVS